jgi:hypothetical protein
MLSGPIQISKKSIVGEINLVSSNAWQNAEVNDNRIGRANHAGYVSRAIPENCRSD